MYISFCLPFLTAFMHQYTWTQGLLTIEGSLIFAWSGQMLVIIKAKLYRSCMCSLDVTLPASYEEGEGLATETHAHKWPLCICLQETCLAEGGVRWCNWHPGRLSVLIVWTQTDQETLSNHQQLPIPKIIQQFRAKERVLSTGVGVDISLMSPWHTSLLHIRRCNCKPYHHLSEPILHD